MSDNATIKEFLVGLGFQIHEDSWSRFQSTVESATLKARLFGDALESVAKAVAGAVARIADDFEDLFYSSQRLGASVESIRSFEYALSQVGGTVAGAHAALKGFGDWMRQNPGAKDIVNSMGVATEDANGPIDRAKVLLAIGQKLAEISKQGPGGPGLASAYAAKLGGIDQDSLLALERNPGKFYDQAMGGDKAAGIGGPMAAAAVKFEQALRDTYHRIETFAAGAEGKLFDHLSKPLEDFNKWLDAHKNEINDALGKIAKSAGDVGEKVLAAIKTVDWTKVPGQVDAFATSLGNLSGNFGEFLSNLDSTRKLVEKIALAWAGMRLGGMFGPVGAVVGAAGGLVVAQAIESPKTDAEPIRSGPSLTSRVMDRVKRLFGGGGSPNDTTTPHPTTQHINGAPVSDGNPMPVRMVGDAGGGFLGWLKGALGIGGADAAESGGAGGGGHAASSGLRRRGSTAGGDVTKFGANVGDAAPRNTADAMRVAIDQLRKEGVAPAHLRSAAALLVGMGISESGLNPSAPHDGGTGYGIYGARLERRDAMFAWLAANGYAKNSLEGQMRFMAHEAMTNPRFARTRGILSGATPENVIGSASGVTTNFEAPGPASWPQGPFNDRRPNVGKAYRAAPVGADAPLGHALGSDPIGARPAMPASGDKHVNSNITNHITVTSNDPDSAASAVGVHLDRTAADVYRNLQGAYA